MPLRPSSARNLRQPGDSEGALHSRPKALLAGAGCTRVGAGLATPLAQEPLEKLRQGVGGLFSSVAGAGPLGVADQATSLLQRGLHLARHRHRHHRIAATVEDPHRRLAELGRHLRIGIAAEIKQCALFGQGTHGEASRRQIGASAAKRPG